MAKFTFNRVWADFQTWVDSLWDHLTTYDHSRIPANKEYHRDSFGQLQSVLTGASTWTLRLVRNTKMVAPHVAKNDVFTYKCQINHDKDLGTALDGFHVHISPIGAVTPGQVISIDFGYVWLTNGNTFPDTFTTTGNAPITLASGDQYKYLIKNIVTGIAAPTGEGYSSEFFIQCTRRNDATDTYAGEFALWDGDVHYKAEKIGSYYEFND